MSSTPPSPSVPPSQRTPPSAPRKRRRPRQIRTPGSVPKRTRRPPPAPESVSVPAPRQSNEREGEGENDVGAVSVFGFRAPTSRDHAEDILTHFRTEVNLSDNFVNESSPGHMVRVDGILQRAATLSALMRELHDMAIEYHMLGHDRREEEENSGDAVDRVAEICAVDITTAAQALAEASGDEQIAVEILLEKKTAECATTGDSEDKAKLDMAIAMSLQPQAENSTAPPGPVATHENSPPAAADKCPVCLEVIWDKPGAKKFKFPCSHDVCLDCGRELERRALTCPVCRRRIAGMVECTKSAGRP